MLSIHQDFVSPDAAERQKDIATRSTASSWRPASASRPSASTRDAGTPSPSFDDLMKVKGDEPPIAGHTEDEAFDWCMDVDPGLPARGGEGGRDARAWRTTGG